MTSNLGSSLIQELATENYNTMKAAVMEVVSRHFRPEFINRIDDACNLRVLKVPSWKGVGSVPDNPEARE